MTTKPFLPKGAATVITLRTVVRKVALGTDLCPSGWCFVETQYLFDRKESFSPHVEWVHSRQTQPELMIRMREIAAYTIDELR
jgi:hypothetical protein